MLDVAPHAMTPDFRELAAASAALEDRVHVAAVVVLNRAGVIVRPAAPYGVPNCLRSSTGAAAQDERCLKALASALWSAA